MPINTKQVSARRKVRYQSMDELLADAEQLSQTKVRTLGNWSQGQIYEHLARTFESSIDGFGTLLPGDEMAKDLDPIWKALSDPTRRDILDLLRDGPRQTTEIVERFPQLSRFGVMKHLDVLRDVGLVKTRSQGRLRINSLNAAPLRDILERWIGKYEAYWSDTRG